MWTPETPHRARVNHDLWTGDQSVWPFRDKLRIQGYCPRLHPRPITIVSILIQCFKKENQADHRPCPLVPILLEPGEGQE